MPYIKQEKREILDPAIEELFAELLNLELKDKDKSNSTEGNINYIFTKLLRQYCGDNYNKINNALGVISAVQLEFYRRVAVPLENQKWYDNGDVDNIKPKGETQ